MFILRGVKYVVLGISVRPCIGRIAVVSTPERGWCQGGGVLCGLCIFLLLPGPNDALFRHDIRLRTVLTLPLSRGGIQQDRVGDCVYRGM